MTSGTRIVAIEQATLDYIFTQTDRAIQGWKDTIELVKERDKKIEALCAFVERWIKRLEDRRDELKRNELHNT